MTDLAELLERAGLSVKPLEWVSENPYWVARSPELRGHYAVEAWDDRTTLTGTLVGGCDFGSIHEAKAVAQADFASRILSALEVSK